MEVDMLGFCLDRMGRAYEEQVWAVALVGAMAALVISQAERVLVTARYWILIAGLWATSALAMVFVWSRHFIFDYYKGLSRTIIGRDASLSLIPTDGVSPLAAWLAKWSGVSLYTVIIAGMTIMAVRALSKARERAYA
jgi:hypothetical protein